nr:unnamed protein product [Callosobruchus analis]
MPWQETRCSTLTLCRNLKECISNIIGEKPSTTTKVAQNGKCSYCSICLFAKIRMTTSHCCICPRALCGEHQIKICYECVQKFILGRGHIDFYGGLFLEDTLILFDLLYITKVRSSPGFSLEVQNIQLYPGIQKPDELFLRLKDPKYNFKHLRGLMFFSITTLTRRNPIGIRFEGVFYVSSLLLLK